MADIKDSVNLVSDAEPPDMQETSLNDSGMGGADPEKINTSFVGDNGEQSVHSTHANDLSQYQITTPTPVYYSGIHGAMFIHTEHRVLEKPDGTKVIVTPDSQQAPERPLQKKDLRFLKIFALVAIILFPPTGIAAFLYALKTHQAYYDGLQRGDMTMAQKYSRRCERLLILSLVLGLLMYCIIVAIVEKTALGHDYDRTPSRGTFGHNTP